MKPLVCLKHTSVSSGHGPTCLPSSACSWSPPLPPQSLWSCVWHQHQTPPQTSRAQCELHWVQCLTHTHNREWMNDGNKWFVATSAKTDKKLVKFNPWHHGDYITCSAYDIVDHFFRYRFWADEADRPSQIHERVKLLRALQHLGSRVLSWSVRDIGQVFFLCCVKPIIIILCAKTKDLVNNVNKKKHKFTSWQSHVFNSLSFVLKLSYMQLWKIKYSVTL